MNDDASGPEAAGTIEAAGGLVVRAGPGASPGAERELLVVHRPAYDDWSLPKGKLDPGEDHATAARREVEEETGWVCDLGAELPSVRYRDRKGRPKRVRYWVMSPTRFAGFVPNDEVDAVRWISESEAATLLSYAVDRQLVEQLPERPEEP